MSLNLWSISLNLPKILLLSTGGTIASKIDYRTGAVTPVLTAEELNSSVPEISKIANIPLLIDIYVLPWSESQFYIDWSRNYPSDSRGIDVLFYKENELLSGTSKYRNLLHNNNEYVMGIE